MLFRIFSLCNLSYLACCVLISCTQSDKIASTFVDSIVVKGQPIKIGLRVSTLIYDYKFVSLETTPKSLIGEINKIIYYNDRLYIVDRFSSNAIFVFNSDGKFLFRVGSSGKKMGQYTYPHDVIIDSLKGRLLVLDSEMGRINSYGLNDGLFIESEEIPIKATRFIKYSGYYGFVSAGKGGSLVITDSKFNQLMGFFPDEKGAVKTVHQPFHQINDTLLLFQLNYNDTIFRIRKAHVTPYRKIIYGEQGITYEDKQSLSTNEDITNKFRTKRITFRYYFETRRHVLFTFLQNKNYFLVLQEKGTEKITIFPVNEVRNDVTFEDTFPQIMGTTKDDEIIAVLPEPNKINFSIDKFMSNNPEISDSVVRLNIEKIKQMQTTNLLTNSPINPILVFFKLK